MVYHRKRKAYTGRKRRYVRRFKRSTRKRSTAPSFRNFAPFGKTVSVNHRYVETIVLDGAVGQTIDYVFSANGMFDPNVTGTGHQPYGFDQLGALYDHYAVTGAKITVKTANSGQLYPFYMLLGLRDAANSYSSYTADAVNELPGIRKIVVGIDGTPKSLSMGFGARKFFTTKDVVGSQDLNGSISANPSDGAFFHVMLAPLRDNVDLTAQPVQVQIDYHAVWSEPKITSQS